MKKTLPTRNRKATGRPSGYKSAYVDQAFKFCLLGLDDRRIAELLGTSRAGLNRWKRSYPRFREAFERGRDGADAAVAGALYSRAIGYSHKAEKIHVLKDGTVVRVPYIQHYPPDTPALNFFLANRQRELWRRDPDTTISVNLDLRQLILDSLQMEEEDKLKVIEHEPAKAAEADEPAKPEGRSIADDGTSWASR